jgi:signal transduction histidine kinase/ligand-binding sensor domain-containing protein
MRRARLPAASSRSVFNRHPWVQVSATLFCVFCAAAAWPLDRDAKIVDFSHSSWTEKDGVPAGGVSALAQTSDGFLWMTNAGLAVGLTRFDGRRFEHFELPRSDRLTSTAVFQVFAPKTGGLWIGFYFAGAAFFKDGQLTVYTEKDGLPAGSVKDFAEDSDGTVWAATTRGLAHFGPSGWQRVATLDSAFTDPSALVFDTDGTLWIACNGKVLFLPKGAKVLEKLPGDFRLPAISESPSGVIWLGDNEGIRPIRKIDNPSGRAVYSTKIMPIDRDGGVWALVEGVGLRRIAQLPERPGPEQLRWTDPRWIDQFTVKDGLTSATALFAALEDREGNVWVGTNRGLDRFSNRNLKRVFDVPGGVMEIAAAQPSGLWLAVGEQRFMGSKLWRFKNGQLILLGKPAQEITAIHPVSDGSAWFGGRNGLWRYATGWSDRIAAPAVAEGSQVAAMAQERSGALWVSFRRRGVFRLLDGSWTHNGDLPSLPNSTAGTLSADATGRIWLGYTENRIAMVSGSTVQLYSSNDGLEIGNVTAIYGQRARVWVGGEYGLALFDGKRFQPVIPEPPLRLEGITGIVEAEDGGLWLHSSTGVVHISATELRPFIASTPVKFRGETYGAPDGLEGVGATLLHPTMVEDTDGKLWIATNVAVFSLDPKHLFRDSVAPPVVITSLRVGGTSYSASNDVRLPDNTTSLRIGYVGVSLTMPEKVRYRYKLDGFNSEWQDAQGNDEAYFVNVRPGSYHFHVIAANKDGIWNEQGATLNFVIPRRFTQTLWFVVLCIGAAAMVVVLAFRFRMRQLAGRLRLRLNERLRERERIARELHDTLLQSTQGLMLRVQAARNRILPGNPAREALDSALIRADEVLAEARDRVQDLRIPLEARADLAQSMKAVGEELALGRTVTFRDSVEGEASGLRPKIVEEAYSIGREALLNAFHHAQASSIDVLIVYGKTDLRVRIRDDGCGIDPGILEDECRAGHWGLIGMRERAREIGAQLEIRSRAGAGTEVELTVPSPYARSRSRWGRWPWPIKRGLEGNRW